MENKLKSALLDIKTGMPIEEASRSVDWKDFEGLVAEILESKNFEVVRNFRMKKPTITARKTRQNFMSDMTCYHNLRFIKH